MVYRLYWNEKFSRDFGLRDQARRAAVSLQHREGFLLHVYVRIGTPSHFYIAQDQVMSQNQFYEEARRVKTMMFRL